MGDEFKDGAETASHGGMDRREFLVKLAAVAGGTAAAAVLVPGPEASGTAGQIVRANHPDLETGYVTYPIEGGEMRAYSAKPKGAAKLAGIIVIHENRGLNPHIKDIARRTALEGYHAIAPDALTPLGGTPQDADQARDLFGKLDRAATTKNFVAAVAYLKTEPQATGKVACMGFCWGGGVTNQVAVNAPDLAAAIPFYGAQPAPEDVPKIKAAMLIHYAGEDARINAGIPAFEEALKKAGVEYTIHMHDGAQHGFMNDTSPRYDRGAAEMAWVWTVGFLAEKLKK